MEADCQYRSAHYDDHFEHERGLRLQRGCVGSIQCEAGGDDERQTGERLPRAWAVEQLTSRTADFFGFKDRGRLQAGKRADLNIIDFDGLKLHAPRINYDLPAGGKRLLQGVEGYKATFVAGQQTFSHGEPTGARPGKLVRA